MPKIAKEMDGRGVDYRVIVVDDEERLRFRPVKILRATSEHAIVQSGLSDGERVCISPLQTAVDGMPVNPMPARSAAKVRRVRMKPAVRP